MEFNQHNQNFGDVLTAMTYYPPLIWTKEVPTKEGWYWLRGRDMRHPGEHKERSSLEVDSIVCVYLEGFETHERMLVRYNGLDANEDELVTSLIRNYPDVKWAGPIHGPVSLGTIRADYT
jgi:hypothetical protein